MNQGPPDYESVGEKLPLKFRRPFPVVKFSGAANNDSFNDDLGALENIKLEMLGDKKDGNDHKLDASKIAGEYSKTKNGNVTTSNTSTEITVAVDGGKWMSKDKVYMAILPVDRKKDKVELIEKYTVTYNYANVTLVRNLETSGEPKNNSWTAEHAIYPIETLDIENMYPWIVTNADENGKRKLIVNKNNFADVFKKNDDSKVMWNGKGINASDIDRVEIRANVSALNSGDFKKLNEKFTALKELKIKNSTTTVPYNALKDRNTLEYLEMTNVTDIQYQFDNNDRNQPINSNNLKTVIMPSYDFSTNRQLTASILNSSKLETLDMRGVASMKEVYPKDGMSLKGYSNLVTVHVQDDVVLGPESFYGCKALTTVNGYVQLGGYGAFQNCTSLGTVSINENTKIYDYTFSGAEKLTTVFKSDKKTPIQPTEIGVSAFEGAKILENIDLTATVTIKNAAFKNAEKLHGVWNKSKGIHELTVNAATIGIDAFNGCKDLQYICFNNLTKVEKGLLEDAKLCELKFAKVVTFGAGVNVEESTTFGTTANTKLFINPAQAYVGKQLYLGKDSAKNDVYKTFVTIIEE